MREKILLVGGGGHAESIIDTIKTMNQYKIVGILDRKERLNEVVSDVTIIGVEKDLEYYYYRGIRNAVIAIGSIGQIDKRLEIYENCKKIGYRFPNIIDKSAIVSSNIRMGEGNFIGKGVIINAKVNIGNHCIMNTGAILEHGCKIENFVHIAPGSVLCGNVWVKKNTHIGAQSIIIQNITVGENTIIGAGSLVSRDISANCLAYGNPAREVKGHE
jgi:sugar O-acyltransferase (sialic acid O-acetyltransferase NeuD family)